MADKGGRSRRRAWGLLAAVAVLAGCSADSGAELVIAQADPAAAHGRAVPPAPSSTAPAEPTTSEPPPPPTEPPTSAAPRPTEPPTTEAPPPTEPPPAAAPVASSRFTFEPYRGLGTWLDVYDWSMSYTGGQPQAGLADIDRMADLGVQTLFIQASRWDNPALILEPEILLPLIDRAHARGMQVVGWFLPTLVDINADMDRLMAVASLSIDGLAVDIEARNVADVGERNRRLVELSTALRQALPGEVISAIVLPPVVMEDVNPNYWPGHPWAELGPLYDVWQPMGYWSNRSAASGWRDGYAYTAENIDRIRARIGQPSALVHPIGGIGDAVGVAEVEGMLVAAVERGAIGGSLYDYRTTYDELWGALQGFRQ